MCVYRFVVCGGGGGGVCSVWIYIGLLYVVSGVWMGVQGQIQKGWSKGAQLE